MLFTSLLSGLNKKRGKNAKKGDSVSKGVLFVVLKVLLSVWMES